MGSLEPAFVSLEEAALDPAQRDRIVWSMQYAQQFYGRLLERAAWELGQGKRVHKMPSLAPLDKYPYVKQRRRVIDRVPGSDAGLADWSVSLLKTSDKGSDGPKRYAIKDWSGLYSEMLRITGKTAPQS